jgi:serine/threonine-protein kinase ATR
LCKPKDDLRKDCRMMEFNTMLNRLLKKDPSCRRRNLCILTPLDNEGNFVLPSLLFFNTGHVNTIDIRTYGVIPLNEECGLIEWVPNTTGLRHILNQHYTRHPNATVSCQDATH